MSRQPNGMMSPGVLVNKLVREGGREIHRSVRVEYQSLRELRRDLQNQLEESVDGELHVYRSRRGQWGEWFEVWRLWAGKPQLVREGWQ